jgi:hypothetical protein
MERAAILALLSLIAAPAARAASSTDDSIDDPKLARRLGARTTLAAPPAGAVSPLVAAAAPPPVVPSATRAPASVQPIAGRAPSELTERRIGALDANLTGAGTPRADRGSARTPVIGIGYRRFSFVQVGATDSGSTTGAAASEAFNSLSLDFYPVSRLIRWGLSTQYGWQDGRFGGGDGDYFIAQSSSLGIQLAGPTVTPFIEGFAGGGYMRRFQFDHTIPTAYWQFGIDAGANIFVGEHGFFSLALGYLRPVNGFLKEQSFTSVYVDTWSVKVGFGL